MENQLDELRRRAEEIVGSAYTYGAHDGRKIDYETARKRGQDEVWEAARKIYLEKSIDEATYLFEHCSAQEAIEKVKESVINIGDEVKKDGIVFVVTGETDSCYYGFDAKGILVSLIKDNTVKTGRHYDIQAILDSMREHK